MSRAAHLLLLTSITLFAFSPTGAFASGSSADCTAAGGTYTKDGPNSICVFPSEPVASPNANPDNNSQTTQTTATGQGNTSNKTQTTCTGPAGQCK